MRLSEPPDLRRTPGILVVANGQPLGGVTAVSVRSNNYFGADRFDLTVALDADETSRAIFYSGGSTIDIDIQFQTDPAAGFVSIVQGRVDHVRFDPIRRLMQLEGRDYSAMLIDSLVCGSFSNETTSDIATTLAQRHGLLSVVRPTSTIIGRYYQSEHDAVLLDRFCGHASEWDLLSYLAQRENFDMFVMGTTLNFVPELDASSSCWTCSPADLIDLHLDRALGLAGGIEVSVKTWNSQRHTADVQTACLLPGSSSATTAGPRTEPRQYVFVRPNLTSDGAKQLARTRLGDLCRHRTTVELLMPGEVSLTPRSILVLQGTGSDFDQPYRIDTIDRRLSAKSGFVQRIQASSIPDPTQFT